MTGSLEVNRITLPGIEWSVPAAIVGTVVTDGEGRGLGQAAGRQLCAAVGSVPQSQGGRGKALLLTQLSLHLPGALFIFLILLLLFLLYHNLVGAREKQ